MNKKKFDITRIREDFPVLAQKIYGHPLVYFDNAATTQKPLPVIESLVNFYNTDNANVHRGVHALSERADQAYELARSKVKTFLNAKSCEEIIFTSGATEGINLIAHSFGEKFIHQGDEIIISAMEHHANIVPWQLLCDKTGAKLIITPITDEGELDLSVFKQQLNANTKIVSMVHMSNTLGTINPIKEIIRLAHEKHIPVLVDAAQSVAHLPIDVQDLDCDFLVFSGHKIYAPTGVGVVYGKKSWLDQMPPYKTGGAMVAEVTFAKTEFTHLPYKFEAGTPPIASAIGLGFALDYLGQYDWDDLMAHDKALINYAEEKMRAIPGLRIIGNAKEKAGIISFVLDKSHPHDIATILDRQGIAIRAGHHCTMPLMERFGVPATARVSFALYNTESEIDRLIAALHQVKEIFA
jgi:cysteine desulfurase / selenocysteine lyase